LRVVIRDVISKRLDEEGEADMAESVILNERVSHRAPKYWSSLQVIKQSRGKTNS
jgi:hypothetical protein